MIARNQCCECGHKWQDRPIGFAIHHACPKCGSAYWSWTNYEKDDEGDEKVQPGSQRA